MPRWLTFFGRGNHLSAEAGTQAYSAWARPLCRLEWVPGESRESKQAYRVTHQPVHVVSQCSLMPGWWLASGSGDQRRLMGSCSAIETCLWRCSRQMATFTLLYLLTVIDYVHYELSQKTNHYVQLVWNNFTNTQYLLIIVGWQRSYSILNWYD